MPSAIDGGIREEPPVGLDPILDRHRQRQPDAAEERREQQIERESGGGSENGQQQALGEELADEAPASRADREADGDLLSAAGGARQQHAGDIGAGDQQDEADDDQQHAEERGDGHRLRPSAEPFEARDRSDGDVVRPVRDRTAGWRIRRGRVR